MRLQPTIAIVVGLSFLGATGTTEQPGINALAKLSLAAGQKTESIRKEVQVATTDLNAQIARLNSFVFTLRAPKPLTLEQVAAKQQEIDNLAARLETLKQSLVLGQIADADDRAKKAGEFESQVKDLQEKLQAISKPIFERLQIHLQANRVEEKAMIEALRGYFKQPAGQFATVDLPSVTGQFGEAAYSAAWNDKDGKQVAWANFRLLPKPADNPTLPKFDDKYMILDSTSNTLYLWAGHFQVMFMMTKAQWQKTETVEAAVRNFIDLDRLAAVDAGTP
jgi:hypothetical protein